MTDDLASAATHLAKLADTIEDSAPPDGSVKVLVGLDTAAALRALLRAVKAQEWIRIEDELPMIAEPILLAYPKLDARDKSFWHVKSALLLVRHEAVFPHVSDLNSKSSPQWWFDAPRGNDMTLPKPGMLWRRMPRPLPAPPAEDAAT